MIKTPITAGGLCPSRLVEALKLAKEGYKPVAGGSDLLIRRHSITKLESHSLGPTPRAGFIPIFYCGKIKENLGLKVSADGLEIGSAVTLSRIIESKHCPKLLAEALESIASPGIRNMATLAGNICNASPAGDSLPVLYVLDAVIETASIDEAGEIIRRRIPIADFITGPGRTTLTSGELVTSLRLPLAAGYSQIFRKVGTRAANALSKLSIAAVWKTEGGEIADFRLAVGACGPTIIRSIDAEAEVAGCPISRIDTCLPLALDRYSAALSPIDDQRSTAEYRKNTALKLIEDIILKAGGR